MSRILSLPVLFLILVVLSRDASSLSRPQLSRRSILQVISSAPAAWLLNTPDSHATEANMIAMASTLRDPKPERDALVTAISQGASDDVVMEAIQKLVPLDPSQGRGASSQQLLDGEWKLLWSAKAEAFSPLLQLPKPVRPDSYQYLGEIAAAEVGPNRVAQGLTGGLLGQSQLWLSSGVQASNQDPAVLDILPPFRFQIGGRVGSGRPKRTIVEAGSDAEFRAVNVRTQEAQLAPPNQYRQIYVEDGDGALRISTITEGDPVIVGAIFVHEKM